MAAGNELLDEALRQPGAVQRSDMVKFQCPACHAAGHDTHKDNAVLFIETGTWGCAVGGRAHADAIAAVLGAPPHRPGTSAPREEAEPVTITAAGLDEILAADPVSLQTTYIVTPWIPDGICALSAKAGVGKGKLLQDLCLARASGGAWLGLAVAPGPALFWSGEQGKREDFRVTQALCRGRGLTHAGPHFFEIVYDPTVRFGHAAMFAYVRARLREYPGLFIGVDSHRRAYDGDESDSAAADDFYRAVLQPLKAAGATVLTLCHPPKTTGQMKAIADENMIRGSGDWLAQLDSFTVLRPVGRTRADRHTETLTMRLSHPKPRSGPQADPLLVTLNITGDLTPLVTFTLSAAPAAAAATAITIAAAVKAAAALFEESKRLSRKYVVETLKTADHGRLAVEAALKELGRLGVIRGPLDKAEKLPGERGNWYLFLAPLPADVAETGADDPDEDPDEG